MLVKVDQTAQFMSDFANQRATQLVDVSCILGARIVCLVYLRCGVSTTRYSLQSDGSIERRVVILEGGWAEFPLPLRPRGLAKKKKGGRACEHCKKGDCHTEFGGTPWMIL